MSDEPITQAAVEAEIMRLSALAEQVTHKLAARAREAAAADVAWKVAHAQAYLAADGPAHLREPLAVVACADLYRERRNADAVLLAAQEAGRNVRAQLDGVRSVNSNLRALVVGS